MMQDYPRLSVTSSRTIKKEAGTAKVTVPLTNWKRLSNAPIELSGATVVHWRDIIVVYTGGQVLLYNPKWNMWSTLMSNLNAVEKPAPGCPLVVFGDKLLYISYSGKMYKFMPETGRWEVTKPMDPGIDNHHNNIVSAVLTCHGDTMFLIYATRTQQKPVQSGGFGGIPAHSGCLGTAQSGVFGGIPAQSGGFGMIEAGITPKQDTDVFVQTFSGGSKSWSKPTKLQTDVLESDSPSHISVAAKDSKMVYLSIGHDIYSLLVEPAAPDTQQNTTTTCTPLHTTPILFQGTPSVKARIQYDSSNDVAPLVTIVQVACPPQEMYTLCAINGCLFAFGGKDSDNQPFSFIYKYDTEADVWNPAGNMCTSRYGVATVVCNREEESLLDIFVMGGYLGEQYVSQTQSYTKPACRIVDRCEVSITKYKKFF